VGYHDSSLYLGSPKTIKILNIQTSANMLKPKQLKVINKHQILSQGEISLPKSHLFHGFFENLDLYQERDNHEYQLLTLIEIENNQINICSISDEDEGYKLE
jgi:hypothetical protein